MKKKAIISLLAACAILLAGCGGNSGSEKPAPASDQPTAQQPSPAPSPSPAPDAQQSTDDFIGLWAYADRNVWLQLWADNTWAMFNELGGKTSEGTWSESGDKVVLSLDGSLFETLSRASDGLVTGDGVALTLSQGVAGSDSPSAGKDTYVGLWQYYGDEVWLQLWDDDTWAQFNELGGKVGEGTWKVDLGSADLYYDDGSYFTSLSPDVGGLNDSNGNSLIHSDGPSAGAPDDPSYVTDWDEIASFEGWWYLNGELDAQDYINFSSDGSWCYFNRSPGMEPREIASGTIVPSAGEPHAYYAQYSDGQHAVYFRYSSAQENGTGLNQIYWDNDTYLFVWME